MSKIWKVLPREDTDLIKQLLSNRGLKAEKEIDQFFQPDLNNYKKDLQIPQVDKAWKRIDQAIDNGEQIIIYGDYDVDGICASAILYKALISLGAKVLPYIPHREKDGYGLSKSGLDSAKEAKASLVITVDNGIVAIEQAKYAKGLGLDLIITDHHLPLDTLPEAVAVIHSINMCGSAVAWCLARKKIAKELSEELLQFVAIGTTADLMSLLGLGRAFVVEGLKQLNKTENPGLNALLIEAGLIKGNIGTYEIGHIIGPRLNAVGRLAHAIDALRLLCTKEKVKAQTLARLLSETNTTRQKLTTDAIDQVRLIVSEDSHKKIHIVDSKEWVPGIIGLIAGKVSEEYNKPAIAISVGETISKGSARSVDGINIVEIIRQCSDILIDVGGHAGAAGFSIENDKIVVFKTRMEQLMEELPEFAEQEIEIEAEVEARSLNKKLAEEIETFSPFGLDNPRPLLATKLMKITNIRTLSEGKHLKFKADGIDTIAFNMGSLSNLLTEGQLIDMAYYLEINKYNGYENLQLKVKDIKFN